MQVVKGVFTDSGKSWIFFQMGKSLMKTQILKEYGILIYKY